jgi:thiol-disulfide isomerase/thioredoxin
MFGTSPIRPWFRWPAFAVVGVLALAAGLHFHGTAEDNGPGTGAGIDAAALLAVAMPDASGKEQPLGQWKGKVLVVNFWATWCVPCREEMPEFVKIQRELGERGLQFVGIAIDQPDKVEAFASELGLNYPALIGGYGAIELSKTLGNRLGALPFTVIVDRSGHVVHTQLGPIKEASLRSIVSQLL